MFLSLRRDAIVDRDEHLAEATMRAHLRNVYRSIEQFTTSHHAFFEGESIERPSPLDRSAAGKLRNRGATDEAR